MARFPMDRAALLRPDRAIETPSRRPRQTRPPTLQLVVAATSLHPPQHGLDAEQKPAGEPGAGDGHERLEPEAAGLVHAFAPSAQMRHVGAHLRFVVDIEAE